MVKTKNQAPPNKVLKSDLPRKKIAKNKAPKFSMRLKENVEKQVMQPVKTKKNGKLMLNSSKLSNLKNLSINNRKVKALKGDAVKSLSSTNEKSDKAINQTEYIMPSQYISNKIVTLSLKALFQLADHNKKKNKMFEEESPIFIEINCIKIQDSKGNISFTLPHSTVASTGEVCLITTDLKKGKKPDHEPTVDHWEEILKQAGVTEVKTIMPLRQLRVEYDQFELKRRLLTQHDFIMVDTRVLTHASHVLGKMFLKKHNMLIPVRLNEKNIESVKKNIEKGLHTAVLRLNEGQTSTIQVGHMGIPLKKLRENILALVSQLNNKFPGGEANIRTLSIKLPLSLSLPLYITLRPKSSVQSPTLHKARPKNRKIIEGDLSTIPGATVSVAPDGTVKVIKRNDEGLSDSDMQTDAEDNVELEENINDGNKESEDE